MEKENFKKLNRRVAISVAVISTFMAVSKVKDDNVVQAMAKAKADAVDTWNEYQAKKLKMHLTETAIEQDESLKVLVPEKARAFLESQARIHRENLQRYQRESQALATQAKALEAQYDSFNFTDDQFDLSDACLSMSLMLLAVSALTGEFWLLHAAWVLAGFGVISGTAGFAGWKIHPDWIVKLLS